MTLPGFGNHPRGLAVCFLTEMWERFSYYGLRALLVFFLTQHFLFGDAESYRIYGAYTALVYLLPVVGGVVADQYLGSRKAVTLGAILLVLGHLGMTIEGPAAVETIVRGTTVIQRDARYLNGFFLSLALVVTGVGFLKTNISTVVGALYGPDDPRRDAGFTIFYMGINLGGAAAPLLCGWLGQTYGWRYGFGVAGIGMLIGLFGFLRGQRHLQGHAEPPDVERLRSRFFGPVTREGAIYVGAVGLVVAVWWILRHQQVIGPLLAVSGGASGLALLGYALTKCTPAERARLTVAGVLILFTVGFWAFYEQMGSSLNLFADRLVDRVVWGYTVRAAMLQGLPSIFVMILAPMFGVLWVRLARRGVEPSTPIKFSLGIGFVGLAFLVLSLGSRLTTGEAKVPLVWFVLNFLCLVMGELCLVPVGMSMVTKLAPKRIVGAMMGLFLLAYSASSFIAGLIAQLTSARTLGGTVVDVVTTRATYAGVFTRLGLMAVAVAAVLAVLSPALNRRAAATG